MELAGTGIWSGELRYGDAKQVEDAAAELEALGYTALWIPDVTGDVFTPIANLLSATRSVVVATGIMNLWMTSAADAAAGYQATLAAHGDRMMIGIGVSHQPLIDRAKAPGTYQKPLAVMQRYLDELDAQPNGGIPTGNRMLAALGPKMLELARTRSRGSHPYLVTPEHTARVREALGAEPIIAAEQGVVLESDPSRARAIARQALSHYLLLPNYTNNFRRVGFTDADLAGGGSDRLIDAIFAWGDEDAIRARVHEHIDAGANHVCIQALRDGDAGGGPPLEQWRRLAPALTGGRA